MNNGELAQSQTERNTESNACYIGVDLSANILRAALVTADGALSARQEIPLAAHISIEDVTRAVVEIARQVRTECKCGDNLAGVGIGVPGLVNPVQQTIVFSSDFPALTGSDLRERIKSATDLPVVLENDANAAAYGEYIAGAGRGSRDLFYITIGNGIGGAIILNGNLWRGASGFAGEFGHTTVNPEGEECTCGNIGCLETVAAAPNIVRRTQERLFRDNTSSLSKLAMNRDFTASDIARSARDGDDFALLMIQRTGRYIGTAVASVINLLNIERIVLGGDVVNEAGELILKPIIKEAKRRAFQPCFDATQITLATLGNESVALGAALLARQATMQSQR